MHCVGGVRAADVDGVLCGLLLRALMLRALLFRARCCSRRRRVHTDVVVHEVLKVHCVGGAAYVDGVSRGLSGRGSMLGR